MAAIAPVVDISGEQEATGDTARARQAASQEMQADAFFRIVEELRDQPSWRAEADKACDYYDGNQLRADTVEELERLRLPPIINNLIQPTIDVVLGLEAKMRTDWRVVPDSEEWTDVAEAQSQKLFEAERETRADRACSDGYASQIKAGIGWTEVARNSNPFAYPYRVSNIHRREIWWDWTKRDPDLSDCMYVVRRRWYEREMLENFFPDKKDVILAATSGWPADLEFASRRETNYARDMAEAMRWPVEDYEWHDLQHRRVCVYEVNYRVFTRGHVLKLPDGRTVELDMNNPVHVVAVGTGKLKPVAGVYTKMRRALWCGPIKLSDKPCQTDKYNYIPWWGYTEDMTGAPYGLIRSMISPQDEVNARAQKMLWMMAAKRVTMDSDALKLTANSIEDVLAELSRPDAVVVLDEQRKNRDQSAFNVDDNLELSAQQFQVMQSQVQMLQQVRGIFNAMLGREDGARSGIAINSLVEQGMTVMAELNDNARHARRAVGERLLDLINADLAGQQVTVVAGEGKRARTIVLNEPMQDERGMPMLKNAVQKSSTKVSLTDVPSTPAYRAQQLTMLTEVVKSMPPPAQAVMAPVIMEMTDIPDRREHADMMRKAMGTPPAQTDPARMTEEERAEMEASAQKQQEIEQHARDVAAAELDRTRAETEKIRAETQAAIRGAPGAPGEEPGEYADPEMEALHASMQQEIADLKQEIDTMRRSSEEHEAGLVAKMQAEQIKADASVEREREKAAAAERIAQLEARLAEAKDTAGKPQRIIMERPEEQEVKKEEVMEVLSAASKMQAEALTKVMADLAKQLADAQRETGKTMAQALAKVEEAVSKPRQIALQTNEKGVPTGATSTVR